MLPQDIKELCDEVTRDLQNIALCVNKLRTMLADIDPLSRDGMLCVLVHMEGPIHRGDMLFEIMVGTGKYDSDAPRGQSLTAAVEEFMHRRGYDARNGTLALSYTAAPMEE